MKEKDFEEYEKSIPELAKKAFEDAENLALKVQGYVVKIQDGFLGILHQDGSFETLKEMKPFKVNTTLCEVLKKK